jgi:hypothetical protein
VGLLLLILIAVASALAGYSSGIGQRKRAESTQVAAQLDNQYNLALQEIEAGQYGRARQRLEYIININPGYPGVTDKLAQVLLSQNSTATPTVAPSPTVTPTPDNRGVEELYSQAQISLQNSDWPAAINTLLALRKADPNYQPVWVDDMLYLSLRSQGRDKILKAGDLEGGIYDLTLAERFGPLDAETKSYQTWAELYLVGASFWKLDWSQAVYYFGQVAPAMPNLRDGSGLTATERYRQALAGYAESFAKAEDWCAALEQYEVALTLGTADDLQAAYDQAYEMCAGVADEEAPPEEAPTAEITPETTPVEVTLAPTVQVTEVPPTPEPPVETPTEQQATPDPNVTPSP